MTPRSDDPAAVVTLRDALDRAPFNAQTIREALGTEDDILSRSVKTSQTIPSTVRSVR